MPIPVSNEHYELHLVPDRAVVHETIIGRWQPATALAYHRDFQALVAPLLGQPWGKILDLNRWIGTSKEAAELVANHVGWTLSNGCVARATVLHDRPAREHFRALVQSIDASEAEAFFATDHEALAWMRVKGL